MTPQLTPKFWIIRAPDGELSVRAAKFEHVTDADIRKNLLSGWVIEATIEADLASPEMRELYQALAALDNALGARMPPHLRDMVGELVLLGYKAGQRELKMSGRLGGRQASVPM